jgi:hypothetical protein
MISLRQKIDKNQASKNWKHRQKIKEPELYQERLLRQCETQKYMNEEHNRIIGINRKKECNRKFDIPENIKTLKWCYTTCKIQCVEPTEYEKCVNCQQHKDLLERIKNFKIGVKNGIS